jgi:hypothetical protein
MYITHLTNMTYQKMLVKNVKCVSCKYVFENFM